MAARQLQAGAQPARAQALTVALIAVVIACCALGAARRCCAAGATRWPAWIALMLIAWIVLSRTATTWVDAKALVLTLAGRRAARLGRRRRAARAGQSRASDDRVLARSRRGGAARERRASRACRPCCSRSRSSAGVLASDVAQYHSSNLAPTAAL